MDVLCTISLRVLTAGWRMLPREAGMSFECRVSSVFCNPEDYI